MPVRTTFLSELIALFGQPVAENPTQYMHEVVPIDYHTLSFELPGGVFDESKDIVAKNQGHRLLQINVRCESPTQYLGMAKHDLYLLDNEKPYDSGIGYWGGGLPALDYARRIGDLERKIGQVDDGE